jgi:hypothetical protein
MDEEYINVQINNLRILKDKISRIVGYSSEDGQCNFYNCLAYLKVEISLEDKTFKTIIVTLIRLWRRLHIGLHRRSW